MRTNIFHLTTVLISSASLAAQKPAWQPAPGRLTLIVWPHGPPGAQASTAPEADKTTAKDNVIAGKPIISRPATR